MMMMCPQCCYCPGFVIHTVKNDKMTLPTFGLFLLPPQWKADTSCMSDRVRTKLRTTNRQTERTEGKLKLILCPTEL